MNKNIIITEKQLDKFINETIINEYFYINHSDVKSNIESNMKPLLAHLGLLMIANFDSSIRMTVPHWFDEVKELMVRIFVINANDYKLSNGIYNPKYRLLIDSFKSNERNILIYFMKKIKLEKYDDLDTANYSFGYLTEEANLDNLFLTLSSELKNYNALNDYIINMFPEIIYDFKPINEEYINNFLQNRNSSKRITL